MSTIDPVLNRKPDIRKSCALPEEKPTKMTKINFVSFVSGDSRAARDFLDVAPMAPKDETWSGTALSQWLDGVGRGNAVKPRLLTINQGAVCVLPARLCALDSRRGFNGRGRGGLVCGGKISSRSRGYDPSLPGGHCG